MRVGNFIRDALRAPLTTPAAVAMPSSCGDESGVAMCENLYDPGY